jgi:plastocyanin
MRLLIAFSTLFIADAAALGSGTPSYTLEIRDHAFAPAELSVPAGNRVKLLVKNTRELPSEFESFDLNREAVVPPGQTVTIWIGPLSAGRYEFFDDFNPGTTGWIVVGDAPGGQP